MKGLEDVRQEDHPRTHGDRRPDSPIHAGSLRFSLDREPFDPTSRPSTEGVKPGGLVSQPANGLCAAAKSDDQIADKAESHGLIFDDGLDTGGATPPRPSQPFSDLGLGLSLQFFSATRARLICGLSSVCVEALCRERAGDARRGSAPGGLDG